MNRINETELTAATTEQTLAPDPGYVTPDYEAIIGGTYTMETRPVLTLPDTLFVMDFEKLADAVEKRLKGKCIGYSFVISYKNSYKTQRSGGMSRLSQDAPSRSMTMVDKFSIASVSKTITAAATMNALRTFNNDIQVALDLKIAPFLPDHWVRGANINTISFRELLTHSSGIRTGGNVCTYQSLKTIIANGIMLSNKTRQYDNNNFALLRILLPKMMCYPLTNCVGATGAILAAKEATQATECANGYKDYCKQTVLSKLENAFGPVECFNAQANPAKYYPFPNDGSKGVSQPDLSLVAGGQGWVMSTLEMADFFRRLHYTELILPKAISDVMKNERAGYDAKGTLSNGFDFYWKNGIYVNGNANYRSLIIGFSDNVQIAMMTNSTFVLDKVATDAHVEWRS